MSPMEKARQRTEAARNKLEGKSTSHLSPFALLPDKETSTKMRFQVIACINGRYSDGFTVWASVSEKERKLLKQHYKTDNDPCECKELRELYERIVKAVSEEATSVSTECNWMSSPVAFSLAFWKKYVLNADAS